LFGVQKNYKFMKRLAVLIHGQPRFINYTWKFIKEEYTIPDIETYYFAHMWEDVGYSPHWLQSSKQYR